ncbi:MAG: EamA family transporter RarD [Lautropia sp.]|nr:EamA family transporter RarD [Lautropia sp.]
MATERDEYRRGIWYAVGCYGLWGLFPLYWYPLREAAIGADQILAQRVLWSMLFSLALALCLGQGQRLLHVFRRPRLLATLSISALLIGANWLIYLWAILNGRVLEASLGYFISPLANIVLGRFFFGERLNGLQWLAVLLALCGILWLAVPAGHVPWVALSLAASFSLYAAVRKHAPMEALPALAIESLVLVPLAVAYLLYCHVQDELLLWSLPGLQLAVVLCSGAATAIPLLFFAGAARRIPLSLLGMLQYGSPTLQLLLGLTLFGERFDLQRFIGYVWVWAGVAVFLVGAHRLKRNS